MISAAAHSSWQPSWIWVSVNYLTNASVDWSDFFGLRVYARFAMLFFQSKLVNWQFWIFDSHLYSKFEEIFFNWLT
jgi:hypothetical protein